MTAPLPRQTHRRLAALVLTAFALLAAGCANRPIVDMKGVNRAQYDQDLAECSQYADEVQVARKTAGGAAVGAAVGAAIGAIWDGHRDTSIGRSAATGAVLGGTGGAASGVSEKDQVVKNCLRGRGYQVLN